MELRVGRSIALVVVIVALAMLTLRHRSEQLHQRLPRSAAAGESSPTPSSPPLPASTPADPDSAATVAARVHAHQARASVHGRAGLPVHVLRSQPAGACV